MRILLPSSPKNLSLKNQEDKDVAILASSWDTKSGTLFLSFDNQPEGIKVVVDW
jgi:hypothetical protein